MDFVEKIVGISIGLVVAGVLFPIGINMVVNSTMPKANPAVVTLFVVIVPIIAIVALVLYMLKN